MCGLGFSGDRRVYKYAKRGYAFGVPGYEPLRVDPVIWTKHLEHLTGLTLLLHLDKATPENTRYNAAAHARTCINEENQRGSLLVENAHFWRFVEDSTSWGQHMDDWSEKIAELRLVAESKDIRSTISWATVAHSFADMECECPSLLEDNCAGLNHPNPALAYLELMLYFYSHEDSLNSNAELRGTLPIGDPDGDRSAFLKCFGYVRVLSVLKPKEPVIEQGPQVHEQSVLTYLGGSEGVMQVNRQHEILGHVDGWVPSAQSPWRKIRLFHKLLEYRETIAKTGIAKFVHVYPTRITASDLLNGQFGVGNDAVNGQIFLQTWNDDMNADVVCSENPTWLQDIAHMAKKSAHWFGTAYHKDLFDESEAVNVSWDMGS